jgi:hypothetical protein
MKKARADADPGKDLVKTTVRLPRSLWRAIHIYALDHGGDFQSITREALEAYLLQKQKGVKRNE